MAINFSWFLPFGSGRSPTFGACAARDSSTCTLLGKLPEVITCSYGLRLKRAIYGWKALDEYYPMIINDQDLTPNQLQDALSKTFSLKKKKGKLRKAWDGSQVIYNVASWGATAIGIYQNPAILSAATAAFWTSCQVISKLF